MDHRLRADAARKLRLKYPAALKIVRDQGQARARDQPPEGLQGALVAVRRTSRRNAQGPSRYVSGTSLADAQGKRLLLAWADAWTCPSNLTYVFAFDDDYAMGVLSSSAHGAWAWNRSSTLKARPSIHAVLSLRDPSPGRIQLKRISGSA